VSELCQIFNVKASTIYAIIKKIQMTNSIKKESTSRKVIKRKITKEITQAIYTMVDTNNAISLSEIRNKVCENFNVEIGITSIHRQLKEMLFTVKQLAFLPSERNCERVKEIRKMYCSKRLESSRKKEVVFIDECGFNFHCKRNRGRSIRGNSAISIHPASKGQNITLLAAMSQNGIVHRKVFLGGTKRDTFQQFINELSDLYSGTSEVDFIMDNCRCHLNVSTPTANHHIVYLPPYSPFLNAIEEAFSSVKSSMKSELQKGMHEIVSMNTKEKTTFLIEKIVQSLQVITTDKCESWIQHCFTYFPKCILKEDIV